MARHYMRVLQAMIINLDQVVEKVDLMDAEELREMLEASNVEG